MMKEKRLLVAGLVGALLGALPLSSPEGLGMSHRRGGSSIVVSSEQSFIDLPDQGFSVSIGSPDDIINYDNRYYMHRNGSWYNSSDYRGSWTVIRDNDVPDRIRRHRPEDIRRFRDNESRRRGNVNNQNQRYDDNRR
jgi:hypothetical protein